MFHRLFLLSIMFFPLSVSSNNIPPNLAEWQDWVRYEQEYRGCPNLKGENFARKDHYLCAWPGVLNLQANEESVSFSQTWQILDDSKIPLPGSQSFWPQQVTVNQQKAVVLQNTALPYIQLSKGTYKINGVINWQKRPESLRVPAQIGLIDLTVNGKKQDFVQREKNSVWLGDLEKVEQKEKDFLKIWVNRLVSDFHPMQMTMAIELDVGGNAREQKLTKINLSKYQLMKIESELNSWIDSQGDLWVQLKPGSYELRLMFKIHGFPDQISFDEVGENWPQQEIWVYQNNERLRSTLIEDASPIDADQAFVGEWQNLPHYVLNRNDKLKIKQRHRGISHGSDSLSLEREMWLSFDNQTYYFFDTISGQKTKDWRVNTLESYRLSQLSNHGEQRLITYDDKQRTGAEIRTPQVNILASGEVDANNMKHASGWDIKFARTNINLNVPPGRKLITITGADANYGDWVSSWHLIDIFFVLITLALVFKFFGIIPSLFASVTLALGYHEMNMPVFLWFNFVVAFSFASKVTRPKLLKIFNIYKWLSVSVLLLALLPFLADQIRFTLYPQLEMSQALTSGDYVDETSITLDVRTESEQDNVESFGAVSKLKKAKLPQKIIVTGSRIKKSDLDSAYEQGAIIQAGKGKPDWRWQKAGYSWNGPVDGAEEVRVSILSEIWVKFLRLSLVLFSILWLLAIFSKNLDLKSKLKNLVSKQLKSATSAAILFLAICLVPYAQPVLASEYPSDKLLNELQNRIYPMPLCQPDCVSLSAAKMTVDGQSLTLYLNYQSGTKVAALIPDSLDWRINEISINGKPLKNVWRNKSGRWISLSAGQSNVTIKASLKDKSDLTIIFPERPMKISHQIKGWELSGVTSQRLASDSLQLTRIVPIKTDENISDRSNATGVAQEQSIADLFLVTRRFIFGSQWRSTTQVDRQAPQTGSLTTSIPLLPFEKPLEMTESIKNEMMQVVIPSDDDRVSWESSISGEPKFELTALDQTSISESWEIVVFPNWNIKIEGIPAVLPTNMSQDDFWIYQYFPRGGEKLAFSISKPPAATGASVAITNVEQIHRLSKRKTVTELVIDYRATRAEPLLIQIGDAELKDIHHDQDQVNLGKLDGVVSIGLKPGKHQLRLRLESKLAMDFKLEIDQVSLNQQFTNSSVMVNLPENRWLIAASGPGYGPAVIYWGELIFFILLAIGLSRLPFSPLNYWQWLVLGLGMSTFSWFALAFVIAWLLTSHWKRSNKQALQQFPIATSWLTVVSTFSAVMVLIVAVPYGLLQSPDMGVVGNGSYNHSLLWFLDQGDGDLGAVAVYTLPIWIYKILMLIWSTWLSFSLIRWVGWIWKDLSDAPFTKKKIIAADSKPKNNK